MIKDFEKSLIPWMGKTIKMIDNLIEEVFEENQIDLTKKQFLILKIIDVNDGIQQNELAIFANRDKSSLTRMIRTMEKKDLIKRTNCEKDKRAKKLQTTKKGLQTLKRAEPVLLKFIKELEKGLSKSEIESAINVIKKVQVNISGIEKGTCLNHN